MYQLKTRCSAAISSVRQCETSATKTFLPQNKKPPQIYIYIFLHQIDQTGWIKLSTNQRMSYENQLRIRVCSTLKFAKRLLHKSLLPENWKSVKKNYCCKNWCVESKNCVCILRMVCICGRDYIMSAESQRFAPPFEKTLIRIQVAAECWRTVKSPSHRVKGNSVDWSLWRARRQGCFTMTPLLLMDVFMDEARGVGWYRAFGGCDEFWRSLCSWMNDRLWIE